MFPNQPLFPFSPFLEFTINEEAIQFLKTVPKPIGVISVAGAYRTGKSYLLNRMLLNRSNGFEVGPSTQACTKGLWIWNKVLKGKDENGYPLNILIIDAEGIGSLDQD